MFITCVFFVMRASHSAHITSLSGSYDPLEIFDTICRAKVGERERALVDGGRAPISAHQPSEQGYLNVTSPSVPSDNKGVAEGSANSEQV